MDQLNQTPSPIANKRVLARRVSLDLTGLPPTSQALNAFLKDDAPNAYERFVDQLLGSPQYGEHMARHWLDVVRYGDTHGLHLDNYREHWPYRDWIINSFNSNQPYNEFSIEQLAGDLLESPTNDQLIATGFNRAHVTTAEGGSIKDEVRVRNVVDRTATFGTVFLGLTVGCAQCHDHKFDPISQKEFYSLFAYFNSLDADPMDGNAKAHAPVLMVGDEQQVASYESLKSQIKEIDSNVTQRAKNWNYIEPDDPPAVPPSPIVEHWIDDKLPPHKSKQGAWKLTEKSQPVHLGKKAFLHTAKGQQQYVLQGVDSTWPVNDDDELFAWVYLDPANPPREIMLQWNDGNWEHRAIWGENLIEFGKKNTPSRLYMGPLPKLGQWVQLMVPASEVNLAAGANINGVAVTQYDGTVYWDAIGKVSHVPPFPTNRSLRDWTEEQVAVKGAKLPGPIKKVFQAERNKWNESQKKQIQDHFIRHVYHDLQLIIKPMVEKKRSLEKQRDELKAKIPTTLIYRETRSPKPSHVLNRGMYDQKGDEVKRRVPAVFPPIPQGTKQDRLALANWLFSADHPLTARVAVNRLWQQVFGMGLVETSEDFGAQGTFPTHPDLLDFLAVDFRENGWNVKRLMKQMVTSSTYRQNSNASEEMVSSDPNNHFFARGRRHRLDAEVLRDQALFVSGLLVDQLGGPSVKPPQPDGLWFVVGYSGSNTVRFKKDAGHEKVHRRSMYTFWKRTAPAPQMTIMNAPSRETCTVRRERTNTPLQALMLMNDPQYVEASRYLGQRLIDEGGTETNDKIQFLFQQCLCRPATESEVEIANSLYHRCLDEFGTSPEQASHLVSIGETEASDDYNKIDLASWTMVANLIMNMDEFVTRN